ncbi:MAG: hypothetical protein ACI8PZ_005626 [Myxococcota bacterium]|jgi:hypothetical protein
MHTLRALYELVSVLIRRLLREGMIRRSLLWPTGLTAGTLVATLVVFASLRGSEIVGVSSTVDKALVEMLEADGFHTVQVEDARAAVLGGTWAALDGAVLWTNDRGPRALQLEASVRTFLDAPWRPDPVVPLPKAAEAAPNGAAVCQLVASLFALYGVVFGLGMVARDRDDGTLAAELALPIARWVPGAARWIAGTLLLSLFYALCVAIFDAIMGLPDAAAMTRHGAAACGAATALGVMAVGRTSLRQSFAGPFAAGMGAATGLIALGNANPAVGRWLPLASVFTDGDGWAPLAGSLVAGVIASAAFALRAARE